MERKATDTKGGERFLPNTIALGFYTVAGTLLTLLQVKLLSTNLSRETFGMFASLRGFGLLLAMVSANGFPALLVRFLPAHESRGETRRAVLLCSGAFFFSLLLLGSFSFAAYVLKDEVLAFVPPGSLSGRLLFWFFVLSLGLMLKLLLYGGLNGVRRLVHQVLLETGSLLAALSWIYIERETLDLEGLFRIFGTVAFSTALVGLPMLARFVSFGNRPLGAAGDRLVAGGREVSGGYLNYWFGALGLSLVAVAFSDFDRYIASQIMALEVLALFHVASRLTKLANRVLGVSNVAFQPEITRLHAEGRSEKVALATRMLIKINLILAVLIAFSLAAFSRELILLVADERYLGAIPLVIILALSVPLSTATAPLTTIMKAVDQVRAALYCDLVWAGVYISLLFALGGAYGIVGIGIAHLAACLAQLLLSMRISNLRVAWGWLVGLGGSLLLRASLSFLPILVLELSWRRQEGYAFCLAKVLLFSAGFIVYLLSVRRGALFTAEERVEVGKLLEKRRLGFLADLLV